MNESIRFETHKLTPEFYQAYPGEIYPEILQNADRPYTCLVISASAYQICIPFRTVMDHPYGYAFYDTRREAIHSYRGRRRRRNRDEDRESHPGLDYSKIVIVNNDTYIETVTAVVNQNQYNTVANHIEQIIDEAIAYINAYINHVNGTAILDSEEFERRYQYTSLRYFHDILGISEVNG